MKTVAQLRKIFGAVQTQPVIDPETKDQTVLVPPRPVDMDEYQLYFVPLSMLPEDVEPLTAVNLLTQPAQPPETPPEGLLDLPPVDYPYLAGMMVLKDEDCVYIAAKKTPPIGILIAE